MANFKISGLEAFNNQLDLLGKEISNINKKSLYEGAGAVADSIKDSLEAMPVRSEKTDRHKLYGATASEKEQIIANYGISKFKNSSGNLSTSLGFTGYVNTKSKRFNDNVPTGMLMQCIEYGTEFRKGTHTMTKAQKSAKSKFLDAFEAKQQEEIDKIIK